MARGGRIGLLCAILSTMALSQACSGGADNSNINEHFTEPELGEILPIEHNSDISFPLDAYVMTSDQWVMLKRADDLLVRNCLRRFGFDFELPDRRALPDDDGRVIGIIEESQAAQYGYNDPRAQQHAREVAEAKSSQEPWPPAMVAVLNGESQTEVNGVEVPEGGCNEEARRALGRPGDSHGKPGDVNFVIGLASQSSNLAEADSRLKAAFTDWSRCMRESGFSYRDPWGPNDDPAFGDETASSTEIATAKADVSCRKKHNVNGIWVAVRTAYQNRLIEENAEPLRQHEQAVDAQLRKAADVVAAGG